jgi:hypothetical protein
VTTGAIAIVTAATVAMATKYSAQELAILRSLFDSVDVDRSGKIHINQLPGLVSKLGKTQGTC